MQSRRRPYRRRRQPAPPNGRRRPHNRWRHYTSAPPRPTRPPLVSAPSAMGQSQRVASLARPPSSTRSAAAGDTDASGNPPLPMPVPHVRRRSRQRRRRGRDTESSTLSTTPPDTQRRRRSNERQRHSHLLSRPHMPAAGLINTGGASDTINAGSAVGPSSAGGRVRQSRYPLLYCQRGGRRHKRHRLRHCQGR